MQKKAFKAAENLRKYDHEILTREAAQRMAEEMGLPGQDVPVYAIEHHPEEIKGARLKGCTQIGEKRIGIGADELAVWACRTLDVEFREALGRGKLLRNACDALMEHFKKAGKTA